MKLELKEISAKMQEIYKLMVDIYPELDKTIPINIKEKDEYDEMLLGRIGYDGIQSKIELPVDQSKLQSIKDSNKFIDIFTDADSILQIEINNYIELFNIDDINMARYALTLLHEIGHLYRLYEIERILNVKIDIIHWGEGEERIFVVEQYYNEVDLDNLTQPQKVYINNLLPTELYADKFAYMNFPRIIHLLK